MPYTSVILKTDGTRVVTEHAKAPDYAFLSAAVGGMIETLGYFNKFEGNVRCTAYCNEEGLYKTPELNREATKAYKASFAHAQPVVGPVVIYWKHPKPKV